MSPDLPSSLPGWETSRLGQDGAEAAPTRSVPRPPGLLVWTFKAETVSTGGLAAQLPSAYSSVLATVTNIRVSAQFTSHSHSAQASRGASPQWSLRGQASSVYWRTRVHTGQDRPPAWRTTVTQAEPGPAPQPRCPQACCPPGLLPPSPLLPGPAVPQPSCPQPHRRPLGGQQQSVILSTQDRVLLNLGRWLTSVSRHSDTQGLQTHSGRADINSLCDLA